MKKTLPLIFFVMAEVEEMESRAEISCSTPFTKIGNLTRCYHISADQVTWDAAETACQNQVAPAHLVSFETDEVSVCEYVTKYLGIIFAPYNLEL